MADAAHTTKQASLMLDDKLSPGQIMRQYPFISEPDAKLFSDNMEKLQNAFDIKQEEVEKLARYILDTSKEVSEKSNNLRLDFSSQYYLTYGGELDNVGDIIENPFPCVCADMLRCDAPDYAKIFNVDARTMTGLVGMLSQGIPWEQIEAMTQDRDGLDIMAMENYAYKHPEASYHDIEAVHATPSLQQYASLTERPISHENQMNENERRIYEEYKHWEHVNQNDCMRIDMLQAAYQRLTNPTIEDLQTCQEMAEKYQVPPRVALMFGPQEVVPDVYNIAGRDDSHDKPIENINVYEAYKDALAQGLKDWDMGSTSVRYMLNGNEGLDKLVFDLSSGVEQDIKCDFYQKQYEERAAQGIETISKKAGDLEYTYNQATDKITFSDGKTVDYDQAESIFYDHDVSYDKEVNNWHMGHEAVQYLAAAKESMQMQPKIQEAVQQELKDQMISYNGRKGLVLASNDEHTEPDYTQSSDLHTDVGNVHVKYDISIDDLGHNSVHAAAWLGGQYTGMEDMKGEYIPVPIDSSFLNAPEVDVLMPYSWDDEFWDIDNDIKQETKDYYQDYVDQIPARMMGIEDYSRTYAQECVAEEQYQAKQDIKAPEWNIEEERRSVNFEHDGKTISVAARDLRNLHDIEVDENGDCHFEGTATPVQLSVDKDGLVSIRSQSNEIQIPISYAQKQYPGIFQTASDLYKEEAYNHEVEASKEAMRKAFGKDDIVFVYADHEINPLLKVDYEKEPDKYIYPNSIVINVSKDFDRFEIAQAGKDESVAATRQEIAKQLVEGKADMIPEPVLKQLSYQFDITQEEAYAHENEQEMPQEAPERTQEFDRDEQDLGEEH